MGKTIAAINISREIREYLEEQGYRIVDTTYDGYIDTILYNSEESSIGYLNVFDNVIDMNSGAFIVDINNKRGDEVIHIIENRSYTSLF